jgi:dimethylaniline monooxygenase (N-oxide forming)
MNEQTKKGVIMSVATPFATTNDTNTSEKAAKRVAVIGAGSAGLCTAKHLLEVGIDVTVFEVGTQVGGLWCYMNDSGRSSAYRTLHINTAKNMTNFSDFIFREEVQRFPSHEDMHSYLTDYANHFGVMERIQFNAEVTDLQPLFEQDKQAPQWQVTTVDGTQRVFDAVCICTGHLTKPFHVAEFQSRFQGTYLHSHDYREPEPMIGKRVCVVGVGNSALDVVSDVCVTAKRCVLVARSGVWIAPKMVFGVAFTDLTDYFMKAWVPSWLRKKLVMFLIWCVHGDPTKIGLRPVTERVHATSSGTVVNDIAYQRIEVKHGIEKIDGHEIHFTDGTAGEFDVLVAATGYSVELPFLAPHIVPTQENRVRLWKRIIPPQWPGLYFVGMLNVATHSNPRAYEHQARWLREFILGKAVPPALEEMHRDNDAKDRYIAKEFKGTRRHTLEEEPVRYFPELAKSLRAARQRAESMKSQPT